MKRFLEMQRKQKEAAATAGGNQAVAAANTSSAGGAAGGTGTGGSGVVSYPSYNPNKPSTTRDAAGTSKTATVTAAAAAAAAEKPKKRPKMEYDSDEDTEGGTWEHRKRMKEMEKTQAVMAKLTEQGAGKHHIADFLPEEENRRFMERVVAAREGRKVAPREDYAAHKLTSDNKGYKMVEEGGWHEGQGLGYHAQGIKAPINRSDLRGNREGLGVTKPTEPAKEDDLFDLYRKRCMLAYRHRPNRLNNPRRGYDGYDGGVGSSAPAGKRPGETEEYDY